MEERLVKDFIIINKVSCFKLWNNLGWIWGD